MRGCSGMPINKNDFVELDYVGKIKESGNVFDVTSADAAKKHGVFSAEGHYHAQVVCVGERHIVKGVDDALVGKEAGKSYTITVKPEDGFGVKDAHLIKVVSAQVLRKQNIDPFPGLQLNASGMLATVKSVSGGRVMLDFNHPLAGRELVYEVDVRQVVQDVQKKVVALLENLLHVHDDVGVVRVEGAKATITLKQDMEKGIKDAFVVKAKTLIPGLELAFA